MSFHPCLSQNVDIYDSCFNIQTATAMGVKTQLRKYVQDIHFIVSRKTCHGALSPTVPAKRQKFRLRFYSAVKLTFCRMWASNATKSPSSGTK